MLKELILQHGGPLLALAAPAAVVWAGYKGLQKCRDATWVLAFVVSIAALVAMAGVQAAMILDDEPGNDLADP
ncbi:MAG: hypothetical protein AAF266_11980, partial [Planctomycetota bacterium]